MGAATMVYVVHELAVLAGILPPLPDPIDEGFRLLGFLGWALIAIAWVFREPNAEPAHGYGGTLPPDLDRMIARVHDRIDDVHYQARSDLDQAMRGMARRVRDHGESP